MKADLASRIIVALDTSDERIAKRWIDQLTPQISFFKVGSELFTSCGPKIIQEIHKKKARVFLDLKFYDIPQTVARVVSAATKLGVEMLNVHASGGLQMMKAAHDSALSVSAKKRPIILGVTVLTSMNESVLRHELGVSRNLPSQVTKLAQLAKQAGLNGVVCSALEVKKMKKACGSHFVAVTPGIRPTWAAKNDQARIVTPEQAFTLGADYIVIGRPITHHAHPQQAAQMILNQLR